MGEVKGTEREMNFLCSPELVKMMIPIVCDKLCMYNKILKAATRKTVQRDALKTL